jgi:quercetin 2,3-dioxygenase
MTAPRYQNVNGADIPVAVDDDGTRVHVICGSFWGKTGPVDGVAADPRYLDIFVPPGVRKHLRVETSRNAFAYVFEGSGRFRDGSEPREATTDHVGIANTDGGFADISNRFLVLFDRGDEVVVEAGDHGIRFLLVSGEPIQEPVAWRGPIVMNTEEQLRHAYAELRAGTFIK